MPGSSYVLRADARHLPLADSSVDLCVTSPPYLNLRAYQDAGTAYERQIGAEESRDAFIDSLLEVTREMVRVTKPTGSIFVNLGDSYRDKGLQLTPQRYAMRCVDELGLIVRAEIVWSKPNGLPESVTDRVRRSHEVWWHFTVEPRYFSAVDEVREAHVATLTGRDTSRWTVGPSGGNREVGRGRLGDPTVGEFATNPLGKLPGSVWTIPTQPLQVPASLGVDHFAAFPMEWPRRIIRGWSPSGICVECGEGRRPVVTAEADDRVPYATEGVGSRPQGGARLAKVLREDGTGGDLPSKRKTITGEACACPTPEAPTRPAVVLDCFGGTGTTALVASALGRTGISCDLSHDYSRLARWRTTDPGQRAAAMQVEKPKTELPGQADLFGDVA